MLSSLRYNFHENWHLFGKNIFHVHGIIFNTDTRLEIEGKISLLDGTW